MVGDGNLVKETLYYDRDGRRTTPDKATRAEVTYRTEAGTVVKREYYQAEGRKP